MARRGAGDIPSNGPEQEITNSSTNIHVHGAYGAPTGAVGGAANGHRRGVVTTLGTLYGLDTSPNLVAALPTPH